MKTSLLSAILVLIAFAAAFAQESEVASVSGRVTSLGGDILENVEVRFYQLEGISGISQKETLVKTTSTDREGKYKIEGLPWGQYRVEFSRGFDHTEVWRFYLWRNARRVLDIGLPIGYQHGLEEITVSGQVREKNNTKLGDATVTLINAFNSTQTQQVRTDKDGKYKFTLIQPGQYILFVTKPGYGATTSVISLSDGAKTEINFNLNTIKQKTPLEN